MHWPPILSTLALLVLAGLAGPSPAHETGAPALEVREVITREVSEPGGAQHLVKSSALLVRVPSPEQVSRTLVVHFDDANVAPGSVICRGSVAGKPLAVMPWQATEELPAPFPALLPPRIAAYQVRLPRGESEVVLSFSPWAEGPVFSGGVSLWLHVDAERAASVFRLGRARVQASRSALGSTSMPPSPEAPAAAELVLMLAAGAPAVRAAELNGRPLAWLSSVAGDGAIAVLPVDPELIGRRNEVALDAGARSCWGRAALRVTDSGGVTRVFEGPLIHGIARLDADDPPLVYLDTLPLASAEQDWGVLGRNKTCQGNALRVAGYGFARGLGTHARATVSFGPDGRYSSLEGLVGKDDEAEGGSVVGEVWADGRLAFRSGRLGAGDVPESFRVDVRGVRSVTLVGADAGDGNGGDHLDWLELRLVP